MVGALALSLLLHVALIAAMALSLRQTPNLHQEMIRVSLVDDLPSLAGMAGKTGEPGKTGASAEAPRGANRRVPQKKEWTAPSQSAPAPFRLPAPIEEAVGEKPAAPKEPVSEADTAPQVPAPGIPATGQGSVSSTDYAAKGGGIGGAGGGLGHGTGTGVAGTGQGAGAGTGAGGSGTGSGQAAYLREHFVYIRDLINKNLQYPATARKLG
ncbi:MAG TPA: hypothetical protein VLW86_09475, partial [Syntrophorhabdales bacterium]|nr:hypothetical protein [Syntrophorhabdales bacterium]